MHRNVIKQLINLLLPTAVFYISYLSIGILPAIIVSALIAVGAIVFQLVRHKKVKNTQVLSILGLFLCFIAIYFTNNEKLYYVPSLASNCVIACFAVILTVRKKSVFHYIVKDFNLPAVANASESDFIPLNALWIAFFALKIVSKIIGILFLDFSVLYWLVFILGDPMTIVVVVISVLYIKNKLPAPVKAKE